MPHLTMVRLCLAITQNVTPSRGQHMLSPGRSLGMMGPIALSSGLAG